MTDVSRQIGAGRVSFLEEEQKQRIYDTALGILADIGMVVLHDEGEAVMLEGGCTKDEAGLVHVPAALVEKARETVPASFMVYDRAGEPAMDLGGLRSYYGNGSDVMHLHDLETGERRLARLEDVSEAARLCDRLIILDQGRILIEGKPAELVQRQVGRHVLEVAYPDKGLETFLSDRGIRHDTFGHRVIIYVEDGSDLYREISDRYCSRGCSMRMATLEDVFLRMTGRELRE